MPDLDDDDLLAMYRQGELEAFEALFSRHHASVFQLARVMLGNPHQAEEVLQDTFLSLVQDADGYEPRGHFRGYLLRIARNRCLNQLARRRAQRQAIAEVGLGLSEEYGPVQPWQQSAANEDLARMEAALSELPVDQREAIALYAYEQMTYAEIAAVLDVPVGTVKTLIHRGRARLAELFSGDAGGEQ